MFFKMRTRKNPKYQRVLQEGIRIKELCKKIPGAYGSIKLLPEGFVDDRISFIQTRRNRIKERRKYEPALLEFAVFIDEDTFLIHDIERYLGYYNACDTASIASKMRGQSLDEIMAARKAAEQKRDAEGLAIMKKLFGDSHEEFTALTGNASYRIILDCIDYRDADHDAYLLHFGFADAYTVYSNLGQRGLDLLAEDIENA